MSSEFKRGCHAVAVGVDFADAEVIKITQPTTVNAVIWCVRSVRTNGRPARNKWPSLVAIRPRGTCKWTLYNYRGQWIMKHANLDVIRMRAVLEGLE